MGVVVVDFEIRVYVGKASAIFIFSFAQKNSPVDCVIICDKSQVMMVNVIKTKDIITLVDPKTPLATT